MIVTVNFILGILFGLFIFYAYLWKEMSYPMAVVYATLIINGKKKYSDVPERIREQVKQVLIDLDLEELAEE